MITMPTLAPTTSLDAPANKPYSPPPITPKNIAAANKENAVILRSKYPFAVPAGHSSDQQANRGGFGRVLQPAVVQSLADGARIDEVDSDIEEIDPTIEEPPPKAPPLHTLFVTMDYSEIDHSGPKPRPVKRSLRKQGTVAIVGIDRVQFANAVLAVHGLENDYAARYDGGFPFKMAFPGMTGGVVRGAVTIEKDHEWDRMTASVGKQNKVVDLAVYIDTDELVPWQVLKRKGAPPAEYFTSPRPTSVPRLDLMAPQDVANGQIMKNLDSKLECFAHPDESGKPGRCLVTPWGHQRVDMELESVWAAGIAAGIPGVTYDSPPNDPRFDRLRSGGNSHRARGRGGPGRDNGLNFAEMMMTSLNTANALATVIGSSQSATINPTSLASEAQPPGRVNLPLPTSASQPVATTVPAPALALVPAPRTASSIALPTSNASPAPFSTACINTTAAPPPSTPKRPQVTVQNTAYSPIPSKESVVPWFVEDFIEEYELESLDFSDIVNRLKDQDLTPDLLGRVPDQRLEELLGMTLGQVLKLKSFAAKWYKRLTAKLDAGAASPEV